MSSTEVADFTREQLFVLIDLLGPMKGEWARVNHVTHTQADRDGLDRLVEQGLVEIVVYPRSPRTKVRLTRRGAEAAYASALAIFADDVRLTPFQRKIREVARAGAALIRDEIVLEERP